MFAIRPRSSVSRWLPPCRKVRRLLRFRPVFDQKPTERYARSIRSKDAGRRKTLSMPPGICSIWITMCTTLCPCSSNGRADVPSGVWEGKQAAGGLAGSTTETLRVFSRLQRFDLGGGARREAGDGRQVSRAWIPGTAARHHPFLTWQAAGWLTGSLFRWRWTGGFT